MTYIVADTQREGKQWAKDYLTQTEKYKVLSTDGHIRGKAFVSNDIIYITTTHIGLITVLIPALCGCQTFSSNELYGESLT